MGVDYYPVLYVGKEFGSQYEARDFYERFFELSEEDAKYIEEENFQEFCSGLDNGLSGEVLNCYNDYGFVLGIDIGSSVRNPDLFSSKVQEAISKWKELFGNEPFDIVHTVCVW